jgi:hypothetical protein
LHELHLKQAYSLKQSLAQHASSSSSSTIGVEVESSANVDDDVSMKTSIPYVEDMNIQSLSDHDDGGSDSIEYASTLAALGDMLRMEEGDPVKLHDAVNFNIKALHIFQVKEGGLCSS